MNWKERQIARFQQDENLLQLQRLSNGQTCRYQIRLNRKRKFTSISEYQARKYFATITTNMILQLKIC